MKKALVTTRKTSPSLIHFTKSKKCNLLMIKGACGSQENLTKPNSCHNISTKSSNNRIVRPVATKRMALLQWILINQAGPMCIAHQRTELVSLTFFSWICLDTRLTFNYRTGSIQFQLNKAPAQQSFWSWLCWHTVWFMRLNLLSMENQP